jgi:outer membrane protein assembly factor BamB
VPPAPGLGAISLVAVGAVTAALATSPSLATSVDPRLAISIVVGRPAGPCPMSRIDGARTGRTLDRLPEKPRLLWRSRAVDAIGFASVAVDRKGSIVVASLATPEIVQVAPDGRREWRAKTGVGSPVAGPVILSDETRVVVTAAGEAFGFDTDGGTRFVADLAAPGRNARAAPLPLDDGGIAVAAGTAVFFLSADGRVLGRSEIGERAAGSLVQTGHGIAVTTDTGTVHLVRPPAFSRRVGTLGGDPGPGAAANGSTLIAVVEHDRLVAFDIRTGSSRRLGARGGTFFDGPVALDAAGCAMATTLSGMLVAVSPEGTENRRAALDTRAISPINDAGAINLLAMSESPPLVIDASGRVAFARVGGRIGVVSPDGAVSALERSECAVPVALAPAGNGRMVAACRDGSVLMFGEETAP